MISLDELIGLLKMDIDNLIDFIRSIGRFQAEFKWNT